MKKSTSLAVSLAAIVVLLVIIAISMHGDVDDAAPPRSAYTPPPTVSNTGTATQLEVGYVAPQTDQTPATDPDSEQPGPVKLFFRVEVFDDEYRSASQQAGEILASIIDPPILRSQILLTDQGLVSEFIQQVTSDRLRQAFDVSPFADDPCTVSTIDRTSPRFTHGESVPNVFQVFSDCDSSDKQSIAWVNMSERSVSFVMKYGVTSYTVRPIGDSKYSLAYQAYYPSPGPSEGLRSFSIPRD